MAVVIDERARGAVASRVARGKEATIEIDVEWMPGAGQVAIVRWKGRGPERNLGYVGQGGLRLSVAPRIARYARWHDVVVSSQRLGKLDVLTLKDPLLLFHIGEWERAHRGLIKAAA